MAGSQYRRERALSLLPKALAEAQNSREQPWPAPLPPPGRPQRTIVPLTKDEESRRNLSGVLPPPFGGAGGL